MLVIYTEIHREHRDAQRNDEILHGEMKDVSYLHRDSQRTQRCTEK